MEQSAQGIGRNSTQKRIAKNSDNLPINCNKNAPGKSNKRSYSLEESQASIKTFWRQSTGQEEFISEEKETDRLQHEQQLKQTCSDKSP